MASDWRRLHNLLQSIFILQWNLITAFSMDWNLSNCIYSSPNADIFWMRNQPKTIHTHSIFHLHKFINHVETYQFNHYFFFARFFHVVQIFRCVYAVYTRATRFKFIIRLYWTHRMGAMWRTLSLVFNGIGLYVVVYWYCSVNFNFLVCFCCCFVFVICYFFCFILLWCFKYLSCAFSQPHLVFFFFFLFFSLLYLFSLHSISLFDSANGPCTLVL